MSPPTEGKNGIFESSKSKCIKKSIAPNNDNIVYLRFRDIEHARDWMADFVNWYNTEHLHLSKWTELYENKLQKGNIFVDTKR